MCEFERDQLLGLDEIEKNQSYPIFCKITLLRHMTTKEGVIRMYVMCYLAAERIFTSPLSGATSLKRLTSPEPF